MGFEPPRKPVASRLRLGIRLGSLQGDDDRPGILTCDLSQNKSVSDDECMFATLVLKNQSGNPGSEPTIIQAETRGISGGLHARHSFTPSLP